MPHDGPTLSWRRPSGSGEERRDDRIERSVAFLRAIAAHAPFSHDELAASGGKPQVMLLFDEVDDAARSEALALATPDDLLRFGERELHWLPNRGVGRSQLDLRPLGAALGVVTVRTATTIARLVARL
ncbi:MAG: hypothetical protein ACFCVK_03595 [Acidimicrobiales bacterium]